MRTLTALTLAAVSAAALTACASDPMRGNTYANEVERLAADCREKGGILSPTSQQSGNAAADNVCRLTNASRIQR